LLAQPLASDRVFFQRRLVGRINQALGWQNAGCRAASDTSGANKFGNCGLTVVLRNRPSSTDVGLRV
jgi:hypothetical protein